MSDELKVPRVSPESLKRNFRKRVPELARLANCDVEVLMNCDSAHVGPTEWIEIATFIRSLAKKYDGVVLLHGTDTLPYTAAALSLLLRPCPKPVVITGAQRPLSALRSDARRNLVSAVEIAATGPRKVVSGVSVFFDDKLFRGDAVQKKSAVHYHAFESPYVEPLAEVGTEIRYASPVKSPKPAARFQARFNQDVALIQVTPGFPSSSFASKWLPHLRGVVMNIFPSGTAPTHDREFIKMLQLAKGAAIPIVIATEAVQGPKYEAGVRLSEEGCIFASGITTEFAFVKMSLLLGQSKGKKVSLANFRKYWKISSAN